MSDFASTIQTGNALNLNQLVTELEKMPTRIFRSFIDSVANMNSTTYAARDTISITTEVDDVVEIHTDVSVSVNTAADGISLYHEVDGVAANNYAFYSASATLGTGGDKMTIHLMHQIENKAGTYDVKVMWNKTAGSVGPVYSRICNTQITVNKKGS